MGEEVTEELGRIPAKFFVRQYVRIKYACPKCQEGVVRPELPPRFLDKCQAGADVIADIVVSKYGDHLPLYRQEQIYARDGVELSRKTMCDWVAEASSLCRPIVEQMRKDLLSSFVIQSDDTGVKVRIPGKRGPMKKGFLWVYVADTGDVLYDFTLSRSQDGPTAFVAGFQGTLQVDGYAGYNRIFKDAAVRRLGCFAHARRKFFEARDAAPREAAVVLLLIRQLYAVEREAKQQRLTPVQLTALRQEKSVGILEDLEFYLGVLKERILPKSPLGKALTYALNQWEALCLYATDGRLQIDNNSAERAMRRVAVGRRNWLFAGSPEGGKSAAVLYSLIETCRRHHINPHQYLTDILVRVSTNPAANIAELTPRRWMAARPDE